MHARIEHAEVSCVCECLMLLSPKTQIWETTIVKGAGLALVGAPVEQGAARWEWCVLLDESGSGNDEEEGRCRLNVGMPTEKMKTFVK